MARLVDAQKRELCYLIAARTATQEILEHFQEKYELEVTPSQIYAYKNGLNADKWKEYIRTKRLEYDAAVDECIFSSKRKRLDACYRAYEVAKGKKDARGMVMAIAQAQKEMEGTKVQLTGKDGKDFEFNINIGPPPEPRQVGPPLRVLPPASND